MGKMYLNIYDVEHGSCYHIITPNNKHIVIDLGSKSNKSICKHMKEKYFRNGGRIDELILTHLHEDHIHDIPNLDTYGINPHYLFRPKAAFDLSFKATDPEYYKRIVTKANDLNKTYTGPISESDYPLNYSNNGGVGFEIFTPYQFQYTDDANSYSSVIVVTFGAFKLVITGDNPSDILDYMMYKNETFASAIKNATVLIAPHHGRDNEFCKAFVSAVNPRVTVFSDGTRKYKSQEYSARKYANCTRGVTLNGRKRYVFTTRNDGNIIFSFNLNNEWTIDTNDMEY